MKILLFGGTTEGRVLAQELLALGPCRHCERGDGVGRGDAGGLSQRPYLNGAAWSSLP
ncbi:MAG: hypothetical protein ACLUNZ_05565 [Evtepia sp.]